MEEWKSKELGRVPLERSNVIHILINSFVYLFSKYLLNIYCVSDDIIDTQDFPVTKADKGSFPKESIL